MKTYKVYGQAVRYTGCRVFSVHCGNATEWTTIGELLNMRTVDSADFAMMPLLADSAAHDRLLMLVTDGRDWGTRCELSRGFPGPWPTIELFADEATARKAFATDVARYTADPRWQRRMQP